MSKGGYQRKSRSEIDKLQNYFPEPNSGCWLWLGYVNKDGYGCLRDINQKHVFAHRFFYEKHKGNIPHGYTVDHECFIRCCVNPQHLTLKTNVENAKRQRSAIKNYCVNGHERNEENIYVWVRKKGRGVSSRICRLCNRQRVLEYRIRKIGMSQ